MNALWELFERADRIRAIAAFPTGVSAGELLDQAGPMDERRMAGGETHWIYHVGDGAFLQDATVRKP